MEPQQLSMFKADLSGRLQSLIEQFTDTVGSMKDSKAAVFADPNDRATMETDRGFMLRLRDRERMLIRKIQQALERIEDGTFGYCEDCGDFIGQKRLEARPVTTLCIECKEHHEQKEKSFGS